MYTAFDPLSASHGCVLRLPLPFFVSRRYIVFTFFFICLSLCLSLSLAPSQKVILSLSLSISKEDIQRLSLPLFLFHEGILRVSSFSVSQEHILHLSLLCLLLKKAYCALCVLDKIIMHLSPYLPLSVPFVFKKSKINF